MGVTVSPAPAQCVTPGGIKTKEMALSIASERRLPHNPNCISFMGDPPQHNDVMVKRLNLFTKTSLERSCKLRIFDMLNSCLPMNTVFVVILYQNGREKISSFPFPRKCV